MSSRVIAREDNGVNPDATRSAIDYRYQIEDRAISSAECARTQPIRRLPMIRMFMRCSFSPRPSADRDVLASVKHRNIVSYGNLDNQGSFMPSVA